MITTPFANRPYQPKPKITMKKRNLVLPTRPNRSKLSQVRRINVRKPPEATQLDFCIHHQQKFNPGSQRCGTKHINQRGTHTRKPANGHSILTLIHFSCSPCKDHRTLKILCNMHPTR